MTGKNTFSGVVIEMMGEEGKDSDEVSASFSSLAAKGSRR